MRTKEWHRSFFALSVLVLQASVSVYSVIQIALVCSITYISSWSPMYDTLPYSHSHDRSDNAIYHCNFLPVW